MKKRADSRSDLQRISTALAIHSLAGFLPRSLFTHLLVAMPSPILRGIRQLFSLQRSEMSIARGIRKLPALQRSARRGTNPSIDIAVRKSDAKAGARCTPYIYLRDLLSSSLFGREIGVDSVAAVVGEHADKGGVGPDRGGADEVEAVPFGGGAGFVVEVIEDFDVVAEESDWGGDDGIDAFAVAFIDERVDVGLRPRDGGIRGCALVGEIESSSTELRGCQSGGSPKLAGVERGFRHALRDGVRGENERGIFELRGLEIFASLADKLGNRRDVTFASKPRIKVVDRGFLSFKVVDRFGYGLLVPVPTDFGLVRRHDDGKDVAVSVLNHLRYDFAHVRRPVAESGVHGDIDTSIGKLGAECFGLFRCQFVKGRESAEVLVVAGDLFDAVGF